MALFFTLAVACGTETAPPTADESLPPPRNVELAAPDIQLLPFSTRINKLAHVFELPVSDEIFDILMQQRFALGDHEYARALRPDRRWSARKMGIWIKGLLPLCESERFAELYPAVASSPEGFIAAAYGRDFQAEDQMVLDEVLAMMGGADQEDRTVCVAILSSLEFVTQ